MSLFQISGVLGQIGVSNLYQNIIIEDPNPTANRLFFSAIGHDATYLTPIFNTVFHYNTPLTGTALGAGQGVVTTPTYQTTNYGYGGIITLSKASINCYAGSSTLSNMDCEAYTAFHKSLDPANYPARKSWYTTNSRNLFGFTNVDYGDQTTGGQNGGYHIYPSDITQGYLYISNQTYAPQLFFYEDPINNKLWGMSTNHPYYPTIVYMSNYDNPVSITYNSVLQNNQGNPYFLGPDTASNTYWVNQQRANGDPLYIYGANANGTVTINTIISGITTNGGSIYYGRPSNVRYDNSSTRVFYTCQFDGGNELKPYRVTWNPQINSPTGSGNNFTATTCTMVYSIGTFSNYSNPMNRAIGAATYSGETWRYQGWQFRPSSTTTWYITFWPSDKTTNTITGSTGPNSTNTRWATTYQRTMMTYSINTTTDSVTTATLTYHSSYTFPSPLEIPRDWLPINNDGTVMAVPVCAKVNFFTFNATTGWGLTNTYPYEMRTMGLDMQNRLWGVSNEIGNWSIHLITPTAPYTVSVIMPTQTFSYTGTNILTSASVYAYDLNGNPYATTLNLSINGNSMLFTDNGLTTLTTTTNVNTGTTVNLTIFGGGVNNIVVGANI